MEMYQKHKVINLPAIRWSHSLINLPNLESPDSKDAPISKAVLAVWYSSSLMHAMLYAEDKQNQVEE